MASMLISDPMIETPAGIVGGQRCRYFDGTVKVGGRFKGLAIAQKEGALASDLLVLQIALAGREQLCAPLDWNRLRNAMLLGYLQWDSLPLAVGERVRVALQGDVDAVYFMVLGITARP